MIPGARDRSLSVEMASKAHVKSLIVSDESTGRVLFDADLGKLSGLSLVDGIVLEVRGVNGVLRVDLGEKEIEAMLKKIHSESPSSESGSIKIPTEED